MEQKTSSFERVLGAWDILVIAFGAMIGWGWVVSTGTWIQDGGILGAALGFVIGGIMIFFVGLTYAELTSAMPQCGGEHVFSHRAMGPIGSFICTWAIVLGYASVVCFEACALPTIITYIFPDFLQGYLYTVAGFKIYASWLAVAVGMSLLMTWINIRGVKAAAKLQTILTVIIGAAGILLIVASAITGSVSTLAPQAFVGEDTGTTIKAVLAVAVMTPFYFIGFDVIPQAAEEIKVPLKKIGSILILSVVCAVLFYALVIVAVGLAVIMSGFIVALYAIPNSGATLVWQEWLMAGGWAVLGVIFGVACKRKYKERFGLLVDIISNEDAVALQSSDEEISVALDRAIDDAIDKILAERNLTPAP